jgi:hypothetical protein
MTTPNANDTPPFTVERYGSFGAAMCAENRWMRRENERLQEIAREVSTLDCFYTGASCPRDCECLSAMAGRAIHSPSVETSELPPLPDDPVALKRIIGRHMKWREKAMALLKDAAFLERKPADMARLIEFIDQSESRLVLAEKTPCDPDDHLYVAAAGSAIGTGTCLKCGEPEPAEKTSGDDEEPKVPGCHGYKE